MYRWQAFAKSAALYLGWRKPASKSDFWTARAADSTSLPTIMVVREATVGPLLGTMSGVRLHDFDAIDFEAEGFGGDLGEDGVGALAHLGAAREDTHAAVGGEVERGF